MDFKEITRTKVSFAYQLLFIALDMCCFMLLLIWRSSFFKTREQAPKLHPITPKSFKEFGGFSHIIRTGLFIDAFIDFNMITNEFVFEGSVWFSFAPGVISIDSLEKFSFERGEILQKSEPNMKMIKGELHVQYNIRVKFKSPLNYKDFPLDDHKIFIVLRNQTVSPGEVIYESSRQTFAIKADVSNTGWKLMDRTVQFGYVESKLDPDQKEQLTYPTIIFELGYARNSIRYALSIILPLALIFYIVLFSISFRLISALAITSAGVTAILAYRFVIENLSPKTGYFMLSDYLFFLLLSATVSVFVINAIEVHIQAAGWLKELIIIGMHISILASTAYLLFMGMKMWKRIIAVLSFTGMKRSRFSSLVGTAHQAQSLKEFPRNEHKNWMYPDFSELYHTLQPTLFARIFRKKNSIAYKLQEALKTVTQQQKKEIKAKDIVTKLQCPANSQFYIWGNLHGAFHSLERALSWLKEQKIINDDLKIIKPNIYFVFNGNLINRGPYTMETLLVVLNLMEKNPDNIFYLRGMQESHKNWTNYLLKQELQVQAGFLNAHGIPLENDLNRFFDTLPMALYVSLPNDARYIRISPTGRDDVDILEPSLASLFAAGQENAMAHFAASKETPAEDAAALNVACIVKAGNFQKEMRAQKGLGLLDQDRGATAWSIFSSPVQAHQALLDFHYDAFAVITLTDPLQKSSITLYNRDIRQSKSFTPSATFTLIGGMPSQYGKPIEIPEKSFNIGSSMALKVEGVPIMGQRTKRGMSTRIRRENQQGGIHGAFIRNIVYNDDYTPVQTRNNINRLMEQDNVDTILLPVGSPTLASYLDYIKSGKLLTLFPITGAPQFRDPKLKSIVHFRGTYDDEVRALIDHIVGQAAVRKFAFFYQNDAYGMGPLQAAHEELQKRGITNWVDVPYQRNSVNFKEQAQQIKEAQPDAIGLFATAQAADELIRQIGVDFLTNKQLFGISFLGEKSFREFVKRRGLNVLFGSVVPNPRTSQLEIVKEYRKEMDKNNDPYDIFSLEGYIATSILLDAMSKITPPVTKEKILQQLESYNNYQFKGLTLTFDPKRRDFAKYIWLETGDNQEWVQKEIDKKSTPTKESNA